MRRQRADVDIHGVAYVVVPSNCDGFDVRRVHTSIVGGGRGGGWHFDHPIPKSREGQAPLVSEYFYLAENWFTIFSGSLCSVERPAGLSESCSARAIDTVPIPRNMLANQFCF
jgi:hypothetical protein